MTKTFIKAWWAIINDNSLLVCIRKQNKDCVLPKWHCNQNESLEECAIREVEEETGWLCEIKKFIWTHTYTKTIQNEEIISIVYMYAMKNISHNENKIVTSEIESVIWLPLSTDGIIRLTHQNDKDFVQKYLL
jgi:ADP-ribose pyrophosphatase YjhB (NUDIX family)